MVFDVNNQIKIIIDDDGKGDPTGVLVIQFLNSKGKVLQQIPLSHNDTPELVKSLSLAALECERKGSEIIAYDSGYRDAIDEKVAKIISDIGDS